MTTEWKRCKHCNHEHPIYRCDETGRVLEPGTTADVHVDVRRQGAQVSLDLHYTDLGVAFAALPNRVIQIVKRRALDGDPECQRVMDALEDAK